MARAMVAPCWPVIIFEADGWPVVVSGPDQVVDLYEDGFWDEVKSAFDAEFRPVAVCFTSTGEPTFSLTGEAPQPTAFGDRAIHALRHFDKKKKFLRMTFRWQPASPSRATEIVAWTPDQLCREVLLRYVDP